MRPIAIVGNLSRDRVDAGPPRAGGGPYYAARALRAVGRRAVIVTKLAERDRALLAELVRLGLPVCWRAASSTSAFALDYDGERRRLVVEEVGEPWTPDDVRGFAAEALRDAEWVHAAPLLRSDFPPETLAALARGRRVSLDGQGLVRIPKEGPLELDAAYDPELLRSVWILKLAEEEAEVAAGGTDERALRGLGVPEVVVTLGVRGAIVLADGLAEHVAVRPARGNPTGAGDAFAAAYVAARSCGYGAVAAARRAAAVVSALLEGRVR